MKLIVKCSVASGFLVVASSVFAYAGHWSSALSYSRLASAGFAVGYEGHRALYLCRSQYQNAIMPGKTWLGYGRCNISFAGNEIIQNNYQLYVGHPQGYFQPHRSFIPSNTLIVGQDIDGKSLYLCRGYYQGGMQPGKTWAGYNKCNISYAGKEVLLSNYAVYVLRHRRHFIRHYPFWHHYRGRHD